MRVIAGRCKGTVLFRPRGNLIRPTSDRIKEFIFDYLGNEVEGAFILDLFSGTANLSIEALSRGAESSLLVDKSKEAIRLIYKNLELTKLLSQCQVIHQDVFRFLKTAEKRKLKFDYIFADPPYSASIYNEVIHAIGKADIMKDSGLFILECDSRQVIESREIPLIALKKKVFGDSAMIVFKKEGS